MHEFKVSVGTTGLIRCLAVSPSGNWLAVGHSTGMLSVLDIRTGFLIGTWLGHEGEILQVCLMTLQKYIFFNALKTFFSFCFPSLAQAFQQFFLCIIFS